MPPAPDTCPRGSRIPPGMPCTSTCARACLPTALASAWARAGSRPAVCCARPESCSHPGVPDARALDEAMAYLYVRRRLSSEQIARLIGMSGRAVRGRLRAAGVRMRTRGAFNREDRRTVAPSDLASLYLRAGLPAAEVGRMLGLSGPIVLRAAHDHGIPVRLGGPPPCAGPAEIELVEALYADALVQNALARHGIARVAPGGPIWMRFPVPARLAPDAASELYLACGLSLRQIELITGQPSETIRAMLRAQGVTLRPRGGRSPFLRRWRAGQ